MTKVYKILVCGGRDYWEWYKLSATLKDLMNELGTDSGFKFIQGGAKGADFLTKVFALDECRGFENVTHVEYQANWNKYGKKAGILRNQDMLDIERPDIVVAFPGGYGTANMISIAQKAGVEVRVIS